MSENEKEEVRRGAGGGRDTGRGPEGEEHAARTEAGIAPEPGLLMRAEKALGLLDDLVVLPFPSHGAPDWLRVKGRVVEARGISGADAGEGRIRDKVLDTIRRLESDEIPGARVTASYRGGEWETVTDDEGYFSFRIEPSEPVEAGWHRVPLRVEPPFDDREVMEVEAPVLVPRADAEFAVVSDLDDTVIRTHATKTLQEIRMVFGHNARTRPPLPGVAALYRSLEKGPDRRGENPLFYVSLSGWNLYDLFEEFFEHNEIPRGPMFMQDLSVVEDKSAHISTDAPKLERAAILMENYPELSFVLIGDSGQEDPETYRAVVDRHPGRVRAIYIRDVTPDERDEEVRAIAHEVEGKGVPMLLASDSLAVAEHAAEIGLIHPAAVDEVRREVEEQEEDGG